MQFAARLARAIIRSDRRANGERPTERMNEWPILTTNAIDRRGANELASIELAAGAAVAAVCVCECAELVVASDNSSSSGSVAE